MTTTDWRLDGAMAALRAQEAALEGLLVKAKINAERVRASMSAWDAGRCDRMVRSISDNLASLRQQIALLSVEVPPESSEDREANTKAMLDVNGVVDEVTP